MCEAKSSSLYLMEMTANRSSLCQGLEVCVLSHSQVLGVPVVGGVVGGLGVEVALLHTTQRERERNSLMSSCVNISHKLTLLFPCTSAHTAT